MKQKCEPGEFSTSFERFYDETKNKQGEDYEPQSLKVMVLLLSKVFKVMDAP